MQRFREKKRIKGTQKRTPRPLRSLRRYALAGNPIFASVLKLEEAIVHEVDEDIFVPQGPCDVPSTLPILSSVR